MDGRKPLLCEDCAGEVRRLEGEADALAARRGCDERVALMNSTESTEQFVNALRAHDMMPCAGCAAARATAGSLEEAA